MSEALKGLTATGVSGTPTEVYGLVSGDVLATHGFLMLSYAEWFKVIGCIYVLYLLMKGAVIPFVKYVSGKLSKWWAGR